jgi:hypothetical protein
VKSWRSDIAFAWLLSAEARWTGEVACVCASMKSAMARARSVGSRRRRNRASTLTPRLRTRSDGRSAGGTNSSSWIVIAWSSTEIWPVASYISCRAAPRFASATRLVAVSGSVAADVRRSLIASVRTCWSRVLR